MVNRILTTVRSVATLALALCASTASADTTFAPGSLIIPASSTYQSDCGAVSMYGLIYNILRANEWLEANRATVCPGFPADVTCKIELYYGYREAKASPNRCTPTNQHLGPAYTGSGTITHDHPKWNDGCDFEVGYANLAMPPVKQLVWATATNPATDTTITTVNTSSKTSVYPRWASKVINHTTVATTDVDLVRYWGGSFIIDDADALTLRKLMTTGTGGISAKDVYGNTIDFSPFRQTSCSFGTTIGGGVNIHSAQVEFTAPTPKLFNSTPPRIALLAQNTGATTALKTGTVSDGILQKYLARAGLSYAGAQGCPPGGTQAGNATLCPNGGTPGQIYDQFDFQDITNGKLAATSGGKPIYRMFWAPHWESQNSVGGKDVDQTANEKLAIQNINAFANGPNGIMTECASIETLEGQKRTTSDVSKGSAIAQLQTCIPGNGGTCSASTTPYGLKTNSSTTANYADPTGTLFNCTDPGVTAEGGDCYYFSYAGDPFVQVADYRWVGATGRVADFAPNTAVGSAYRPGVLPLISGVTALDSTKLSNPSLARSIIKGDFVSRSYKDNDPKKSNVIYLGGHDLTGAVSGTKVVLQTLLQLGEPPPELKMKEVSRSTAIPFELGGVPSLIQGTFEKWTPSKTAPVVNQDGDLVLFKFPHVIGHLRAYPVANIGTDQVDYAKITPTFDVATKIPAATYAGCGTNAFKGSCRTIFTNLATGAKPARVLFSTSTVSTIGPVMATGATLNATTQDALVKKVLDGKLGGVDRSTVAVIPASAVTNATRPTMIYFGGLDGMMHAVCGSVAPGTACATQADLGRELWAFMPRTQLPRVRKNTTRIDGSPRVVEMFGDFGSNGTRGVRTILLFQTGSGNATASAAEAPALYALDITNPQDPTIMWEYAGGAAQPFEMGVGLTVAAGRVQINGATKLVAFAQTQNGGTGGVGVTVTAVNIETGAMMWRWGSSYPAPRDGASGAVPSTGIPGGATTVDRASTGFTTDVVFGTLYGDIWQLDATTGVSRHAPNPLFRFTADKKPFGAAPALMSKNGALYAVAGSGGYADTSATILWSGNAQQVVALSTGVTADQTPLNQMSGAPNVAWVMDLAEGERMFSQATVIGTEVLVTADVDDVNQIAFGDSQSGKLYRVSTSGAQTAAAISIAGGSSSVAGYGNQLWVSGGKAAQQISAGASTSGGEVVNTVPSPKVTRRLWLKTQ